MHHGFVRIGPVFIVNGHLRPPESVSAQGICISWIRAPLQPLRCHGRWPDGLSLT